MARKYYTATQGTVTTTGSANGVNTTFRPEESKAYAIFHNLIQGYSASDQPSTIKLVATEPYWNSYPNGTTAPVGDPTAANVANGSAIANLTELFTGTTINATNWLIIGNGSASNVYVSGDAIKLKSRFGYSIAPGVGSTSSIGIQSARKFNIRSSQLTFEATGNSIAMVNHDNLHMGFKRADSTDSPNTIYFSAFMWNSNSGFETKWGDTQVAGYGPYDKTNYRFMRLKEDGGSISFWTSTDGNTWSILGSNLALSTTGIGTNATLCQIFVTARNYTTDAPSQIWSVENINYMAVAGEPGAGGVNANGVNIAAFSETFTGGANTTLWLKLNEGTTPNLVYANNRLELKARNLSNAPKLRSKNRYNLQSSSVTFEIPSVGTADNNSQEIIFNLNSHSDDDATHNTIRWMVNSTNYDNQFRLYHNASVVYEATSGTWSATGTRFYRIAEQGGKIYWFKGSNTSVWQEVANVSLSSYPNINVKNLRVEMSAWCWSGDSLNTVAFDNLNMLVKQDNNIITLSETNMTSEYLSDRHWNGGVSIYTPQLEVLGNTNVVVQATTSGGGTLSLYDQSLTILELTANDIYSTSNTLNAKSFIGRAGNSHATYRTAETITIPTGDYIIIGSAAITDNKAIPSAANNIRMAVFDDTEKVAYGYRDSINKYTFDQYVPYWYVGTHSLDNTRTYNLIYNTPRGTWANVKSSTLLALSQNDIAETKSFHQENWSSTTAGSWTNITSYTFTPTFATNYLVLGAWSAAYSGTTSVYSKLTIDGSSVYSIDLRQEPPYITSTNSPDGSKFINGYIGVQSLSQTTKTANIQAYSQVSGQTSLIGNKNVTFLSLGDKETVSDLYVKSGDTWYQTAPYVKVDGTWKSFTPSYKVGGTWRTASVTEVNYEYAATQNTYFAIDTSSTGATVSIRGIGYGKDTYIVGGHGGLMNTSTDGTTWVAVTSGSTTSVYGITFGINDDYFVASNSGGYTATSRDGTTWGTWAPVASGATNNAVTVEYFNGFYLLGTVNGNILKSTNGITWTYKKQQLYSGGTNGFAYGEGRFVAVGSTSVYTSDDDGENWTSRTSGATGTINDVTYGKDTGKFVYVTGAGGIGTSTDGTTWSYNSSVTATALYKIMYGNGLYVGCGDNGFIISSTDATTWSTYSTGSATNHSAIAYIEGRGDFIMGGQNGSIVRSYRVRGSEDYSNKFI
jgi:hypothetical protein